MHKNIINKENNLLNHSIKTKVDLKIITIVSQYPNSIIRNVGKKYLILFFFS